VNKWDAAADRNKKAFASQVRDELKFLDYAPIAFLSALTGAGVAQLFGLIRRGCASAMQRIGTGELNRFLSTLEFDGDVRVKYITQAGVRPPRFVVFIDGKRGLHFSAERYLVNRLRERFGFAGTPIVVKARR
jgi:GTP-binding protein